MVDCNNLFCSVVYRHASHRVRFLVDLHCSDTCFVLRSNIEIYIKCATHMEPLIVLDSLKMHQACLSILKVFCLILTSGRFTRDSSMTALHLNV